MHRSFLFLFFLLLAPGMEVASQPAKALPRKYDTLIAGGDTVICRWEHDLVARHGIAWPLAGVASLLRGADAAFCNLENCISRIGKPVDKGERCSFYYRARPEMLACLTGAGIDIVTAANNHGGDYGPASVRETVTHTRNHGLVCLGNGPNLAAAEIPRLVRIGRTRVAFLGMDVTTPCFQAGPNRAGTYYASEKEKGLGCFTEKMKQAGAWARGRCDLLILTLHWGKNWVRETQPVHRQMARIAFAAGVDVILGHSAHRLQGIEVIAGKPVIYDMGNLLFDCALKEEGRMSALFRLCLSPAGVSRIEILPVRALHGYTTVASATEALATLVEMDALCAPLGTKIVREKDGAGGPMGVVKIAAPQVTPRPDVEKNIKFTTLLPAGWIRPGKVESQSEQGIKNRVTNKLPLRATRLAKPYLLTPGIELLGYHLPDKARARSILPISTWLRTPKPVQKHWLLAVKLVIDGKVLRRGTTWYTRHDPGDWSRPFVTFKPGEIVADHYPARLSGLPAGPCDVYLTVIDPARPAGKRLLGKPFPLGRVFLKKK